VLPKGHVGIVVCGTRRAEQWRVAFEQAGIPAVVVETDTDEAEGGACKVGVAKGRVVDANAIVTAVTRGERRLPGDARLGLRPIIALLVIAGLIGALLVR
jgi:hypothetical protein